MLVSLPPSAFAMTAQRDQSLLWEETALVWALLCSVAEVTSPSLENKMLKSF